MRKKFWLSLILLPVLALGIACGGGDDDDGGDGGSDGGSQPTAAATSGGGGSGGGGGSTSPTSEPSNDDEVNLEDCEAVQELAGFAGIEAFDPTGEDFDPDIYQELADRAPDEIKDDMQTFADAFSEFFGLLEELNVDFSNPASFASLSAADQARLDEASQAFSDPELEEAINNIEAYFEERC
jgi:hypothetical protein